MLAKAATVAGLEAGQAPPKTAEPVPWDQFIPQVAREDRGRR
mgnify:CR=1 FL=1